MTERQLEILAPDYLHSLVIGTALLLFLLWVGYTLIFGGI